MSPSTACAVSTDPLRRDFDEHRAWTLRPTVSLRRESFGALAYDFESRRLSFLKHSMLVKVVEALPTAPTASSACEAVGVPDDVRGPIIRALAHLADKGMIVERVT
jgi:putative mycofactocin binding protein MftB